MAYEVIARKWRPQQFDDVVGQDHVVQTLGNAIAAERVAHAYLFVGPRGTGKTTTARIFAKALNCEKGPTLTPCDECSICQEIALGNSLDVLEIDGASNNGVEQVRDLRQNVQFAPARCRFKIYIIDEVHMLSIAAFNALLKTLEEPPPHVKFLFATTEAHKVPATILSRVQRFDLRRISTVEIVNRLELICKAEGIDIDAAALLAVARGADGGLRDAQSALDQLIAFRGKTVREEDVLSVFGLVAWQSIRDLVDAILSGEVPRVLELVAGFNESGKDMQRLVIELLDYFRNLLVCLYGSGDAVLSELTPDQRAALEEQKASTDAGKVLQILQILAETDTSLRQALSKRTLVETALIRCTRSAALASIDSILKQLDALKAQLGGASAPSAPIPAPAAAAPVEAPKKKRLNPS